MSTTSTTSFFSKHVEGWSPTPIATAKVFKPRRSQARAYKQLRGKTWQLISACTGWGKSRLIQMLVLDKLQRNKNLKAVIAVPQIEIGHGFSESQQFKMGAWDVAHTRNLCTGTRIGRIKKLEAFVRRPASKHIHDRIMVVTHATLASSRFCGKDTVLWIDEAHHLLNAQGERDESNKLGRLAEKLVSQGHQVGLATATFFRGDQYHILSPAAEAKFTRFHAPIDAYLKEVKPVQNIKMDMVIGPVCKSLKRLGTGKKTIIYIQKPTTNGARDKHLQLRDVLKCLANGRPITKGDVIRIGSLRVLDMVTVEGRDRRRQVLKTPDSVDIIIALDTCKEGFDWPAAERGIVIGPRNSMVEMIQIMGRFFRPKKRVVEIYHLMQGVDLTVENDRNSYLTHLFSAMLFEDWISPKFTRFSLCEMFKREDWSQFLLDLSHKIQPQWTLDDALPALKATLKKFGREGTNDEALNIWHLLAIKHPKLRGRKNMSMALVKKTSILGCLTGYSSAIGLKTLRELRGCSGATRSTEEWLEVANWIADRYAKGEDWSREAYENAA